MKLWLNGHLLDEQTARIDPAERGFTLGDGLFETMAAYGGKVVWLEAHLARLRQGCEILRLPYPSIEWAAAIAATLKANHLTEAAVRLILSRGIAPRGLLPPEKSQPTLLITTSPLPAALPPARVILATVTRRNEYSPLARIKSLNYLDNILARQEAARRAADDAILLNTKGFIVETTTANLFMVKQGQLLTPPLTDGALPGIMRGWLLAEKNGREQSLKPEDLATADEIFLTNSLGIRPLATLEDKPAAKDPRHTIAAGLIEKIGIVFKAA